MAFNRRVFLFSILISACLFVGSAQAASYTVTNTSDAGAGSLRDAVAQANGTTADDTITFNIPASDANCAASGVCTITLTGGAITINAVSTAGKLTVTNSTGATKLLVSGNNASRIFILNRTADLTVSGVTMTKGNDNSDPNDNNGGAITTDTGSVLTLNGSAVTNSISQQSGGGIYVNQGTLNLTDSRVSGNSTGISGGGFRIVAGTTNVLNSAIVNNTSTYIGGGLTALGTLNLTNSTVSGNSAANFVGGIYLYGTLNMTNSTVSANRDYGFNGGNGFSGGLYEDNSAKAFVRNSIIAGNVSNANGPPDVFRNSTATFTSLGNNLIGNSTNTGNPIAWQSSDILDQDPRLAPLADNGGATPTQALMMNSPAINTGNNCVTDLSCPSNNPPVALTTDQRGAGFVRKSGANVDIGAFEYQQSPTAASVSIGGRVLVGEIGLAQARVTLTDMSGDTQYALTDSFGYYRFDDVVAGETYILSVFHKRYTFAQPSQMLNATDNATEVNFIGNSEKRLRIF